MKPINHQDEQSKQKISERKKEITQFTKNGAKYKKTGQLTKAIDCYTKAACLSIYVNNGNEIIMNEARDFNHANNFLKKAKSLMS